MFFIYSSNTSNYNEPPTHDWVELPINVSNPPPLPPKPGIMPMPDHARISVRPPSPPPPLPPRRDQAPMSKFESILQLGQRIK